MPRALCRSRVRAAQPAGGSAEKNEMPSCARSIQSVPCDAAVSMSRSRIFGLRDDAAERAAIGAGEKARRPSPLYRLLRGRMTGGSEKTSGTLATAKATKCARSACRSGKSPLICSAKARSAVMSMSTPALNVAVRAASAGAARPRAAARPPLRLSRARHRRP